MGKPERKAEGAGGRGREGAATQYALRPSAAGGNTAAGIWYAPSACAIYPCIHAASAAAGCAHTLSSPRPYEPRIQRCKRSGSPRRKGADPLSMIPREERRNERSASWFRHRGCSWIGSVLSMVRVHFWFVDWVLRLLPRLIFTMQFCEISLGLVEYFNSQSGEDEF